jgi:hypothetical protein
MTQQALPWPQRLQAGPGAVPHSEWRIVARGMPGLLPSPITTASTMRSPPISAALWACGMLERRPALCAASTASEAKDTLRACARVCVRACARACMRVCACGCVHMFVL